MKNMITFVVFFAGAAFLVLLVSQNHNLMSHAFVFRLNLGFVQVKFMPVRLDVLLLIAIAAGYGWAWLSGLPSRVSRAMELRKLRKQVKKPAAQNGEFTTSHSTSVATTDSDSGATQF